MKNIWDSISNTIINVEKGKIQQYNISNEAFNDALNDNPEEVPDEIPEDPQQDQQATGGGDGMGDPGAMDATGAAGGEIADADAGGGYSDTGGGDTSTDTSSTDEEELDVKIEKNKFADINAKIYVIELYDRLLDSINKAKEILNDNPNLKSDISLKLEDLSIKVEDEKQSAALYSKSENLVRYNLYFKLTTKLLNKIITKNEGKNITK